MGRWAGDHLIKRWQLTSPALLALQGNAAHLSPASLPYSDCSTGCSLRLACTLWAPPTSLLRDRTQRDCPHSVLLLSSEYFRVELSGTLCVPELVLRSCAVTHAGRPSSS